MNKILDQFVSSFHRHVCAPVPRPYVPTAVFIFSRGCWRSKTAKTSAGKRNLGVPRIPSRIAPLSTKRGRSLEVIFFFFRALFARVSSHTESRRQHTGGASMSSSTAATCVYGGYVISVGLKNSKQARFFVLPMYVSFFRRAKPTRDYYVNSCV